MHLGAVVASETVQELLFVFMLFVLALPKALSLHLIAIAVIVPMIFVVALAGSLARQKQVPASAGTLPTHRPLFAALLLGVIFIVVGLTYFPAQALGPIAEGLR